jgi:hypothetical protein
MLLLLLQVWWVTTIHRGVRLRPVATIFIISIVRSTSAGAAAGAAAAAAAVTFVCAGLVGDNQFTEGFVSGMLLIFFSEIGDKTFFIALLLALRQVRGDGFLQCKM